MVKTVKIHVHQSFCITYICNIWIISSNSLKNYTFYQKIKKGIFHNEIHVPGMKPLLIFIFKNKSFS